ncbi:MAG: cation diffusion facilitator family transporter [Bacilli bacterium]
MYKLLVKLFIKNKDDVHNIRVRTAYGSLCGVVGIISNIFIALMKIITGFITGSIAISADGVNSLTDGASSIVTLIAFRLSSSPPDSKHPFGHERIEYISGLIVSFVILIIGIFLAQSSIQKIISPVSINLDLFYVLVGVLVISILIKVWQSRFYFLASKKINSSSLKASSFDSLTDVISTTTVLVSMIIIKFTGINLDGYLGLVVSLFIIYSGIKLVKETISPLLGEAPEEGLIDTIKNKLNNIPESLGYHDLVIHTYGTRVFATAHLEMDASEDIFMTHEIIDRVEREFYLEYNINMVIHMDPVDLNDETYQKMIRDVEEIIKSIDEVVGFHDLRFDCHGNRNSVLFDVVVPDGFKMKDKDLKKKINEKLKKIYPDYDVIIMIDHYYI